jgi:hypothetical protein
MWQGLTWAILAILVNWGLRVRPGSGSATEAGGTLPQSCENSLYKEHTKMRKILGNSLTPI